MKTIMNRREFTDKTLALSDHITPLDQLNRYLLIPIKIGQSVSRLILKIAVEVKAGTSWRGEAFLAPFAPVSRFAAA